MANDSLWPVIVGGLLAMGGIAINNVVNFLLNRQKSEEEKRKERAAKFEELVAAIYEFDHWLDIERNRGLGSITDAPTMSPFAKIQAIGAVHFPNLDPLIRELEDKTATYRNWIETANYQRQSGQLVKFPSGYMEALKPYMDARDKLIDELKGFAHRKFR